MVETFAVLQPPTTLPILPPPTAPRPPNAMFARFVENPRSFNRSLFHAIERVCSQLAFPLFASALLALTVLVLVVALRRQLRQRLCRDATVLDVALPPSVTPYAALRCWTTLHDLIRPSWKAALFGQPHLAFEVVWRGSTLQFRMWVPSAVPLRLIERAISGAWPGSLVSRSSAEDIIPDRACAVGGEMRLQQKDWYSLEVDHSTDPLVMLCAAVGELMDGQGAVVQTVLRPINGRRMARLRRAAESLHAGRSHSRSLRLLDVVEHRRAAPVSAMLNRNSDVQAMAAKAASPGWEALVRYCAYDTAGPSDKVENDLRTRAHGLASSFALFSGRNRLRRKSSRRISQMINDRKLTSGDTFSTSEIAALAHLPLDGVVSGTERASARRVSPPNVVPERGKVVGIADAGSMRRVAIAEADSPYHVHMLGATGSGKSTLLTNFILDDFENGRGAVVLDPKGDLVDDVLDRIDARDSNRVMLIDPDETDLSASLDVLRCKDGEENLVVDNIVGIFGRIFQAYWGPRTDDVLRAACLSLIKAGRQNLAEVPMLFFDKAFREKITQTLSDHSGLGGFWTWFEALGENQQSQVVGPVMSKLRAFFLRQFVRDVMNPAERVIDLSHVFDGKLLLVRLPKGVVGEETAKLVGSLVVARVWQSALARIKQSPRERLSATLYIDECHNFLNLPGSIDDMLAEARGYGLSMVLAHQHLGQLSPELRTAISANARNKIFFSMSPEDARSLEPHVLPELTSYDLGHLDGYQVAARLVVNGKPTSAFTAKTRQGRAVHDVGALKLREQLRVDATQQPREAMSPESEMGVSVADELKAKS